MRLIKIAPLVLATAALAGCGDSGGDVVTDPSKLQPLTEEQKAGIAKADTSVDAEESNTGGIEPLKKGKSAKNR